MILIFNIKTIDLKDVTKLTSSTKIVQIAWELYSYNRELLNQKDYMIIPEGFSIPQNYFGQTGITNEVAHKFGKQLSSVLEEISIDIKKADILVIADLDFNCQSPFNEFRNNNLNNIDNCLKFCIMIESNDYYQRLTRVDNYPTISRLYNLLFNSDLSASQIERYYVHYVSKTFWKLVDLNVVNIPDKLAITKDISLGNGLNQWFNNLQYRDKLFISSMIINVENCFSLASNKFKNFRVDDGLTQKLKSVLIKTRELLYPGMDMVCLSKFTNLESLRFGNSMEIDYGFTEIDTDLNFLPDLSSLINLKELSFTLSNDKIESLATLKQIEKLRFSAKEITNINFLEGLVNLKELRILNCNIQNIDPLKNLKKLDRLEINSPNLSDIAALENLPNLRFLRLSTCQTLDEDYIRKRGKFMELKISAFQNRF